MSRTISCSSLDELVNELFVDNAQHLRSLGYILYLIAKEHSELITMTHLKHIFSSFDDISSQNNGILFQSLTPVANYQPYIDGHKMTEENQAAMK
jgi:hypothetical protein